MGKVLIDPTTPVKISEKLFTFMGKLLNIGCREIFTHIEITPIFMKYIKDNELRDHNDERLIIVNNELRTLFNMDIERVTYSELSGYLYHHYTKV